MRMYGAPEGEHVYEFTFQVSEMYPLLIYCSRCRVQMIYVLCTLTM